MPRKSTKKPEITETEQTPPSVDLLDTAASLLSKQEISASNQQDGKRVFKYERLSATMLKTFLLCRRQFHNRYILGKKSAPNISFSLGTAVHYALEQANKSLKDDPRELNPLEVEDFVQIFRETAARAHLTSVDLFNIGEELVRTELETYDLREKIIGIEQEFDLMTPEGVRLFGYMDKVVELDSRTIKIVDYKTSLNPMSYEDARVDEQLAMYDLAASLMYPQYQNRKIQLKYLRSGEDITITKSEIEQHNFRKQLLAVHNAIIEYVSKANDLPTGELNDFCSWCSFKSDCPQYINLFQTQLPDYQSIHDLTDETFLKVWKDISNLVTCATKTKDMLKIWAAQRLEVNPDEKITDGDLELYSITSTRRDYDAASVAKSIPLEDLINNSIIKINNKNLNTYLKTQGDKSLVKKIEQGATIKFNNPSFKVKKVK